VIIGSGLIAAAGAAAGYENTKSLHHDGVDEYTHGGNIFAFERTDAFSISQWLRFDRDDVFHQAFAKAMAGLSDGRAYFLQLYPTSQPVRWVAQINVASASGIDVRGNFDWEINTWYHWVFTYDGSSNASGVNVYINGSLQTPTSATGSVAATIVANGEFRFGRSPGGTYLDGYQDDSEVWSKALSQAEVTELYNGGAPMDALSHSALANLLAAYRFGDLTDSTTTIVNRANPGTYDLTPVNFESADFEAVVP
jgi:hypothetical protein